MSKPSKNPDGTVTITQEEYCELKKDSLFLNALQAAGVDNWEGYGEACTDEYYANCAALEKEYLL